MKIIELSPEHEENYRRFVGGRNSGLLYQGLEYRNFLVDLLGVRSRYLIALDEVAGIVGALPMTRTPGPFGDVINSLPYYGSNGGVLADDPAIAKSLVAAFNDEVLTGDVATATLIENPLDDVDYSEFKHDLTDSRIGQFTPLPEWVGEEATDGVLLERYHQKTRNLVRKAIKLGISVAAENDALAWLRETHRENMAAIDGVAKQDRFFEAVPRHFNANTDYQIFVARRDREPIAALLVFYACRTVEYYMPVIAKDFRQDQGLSLCIHTAMKIASERGYLRWNWGGTWNSQHGVYHFKSRWGTRDRRYTYFTRVRNNDVLRSTPKELLAGYPYTFVVPFAALEPATTAGLIS